MTQYVNIEKKQEVAIKRGVVEHSFLAPNECYAANIRIFDFRSSYH